jgi:hypothetical protein
MKPEHQQIFNNSPEPAQRSKLDAYGELILRWKRQGRSYRNIQQLALNHCQLEMSLATLHGFIKRRSRPRKPEADLEIKQSASAQTTLFDAASSTAHTQKRLTPEERAAQVEFVRSLNKPEPEVQPKPRWTFDPSKPRSNKKEE